MINPDSYINDRNLLYQIRERIAAEKGMANTPNLASIDRVLVAVKEIEAEKKEHNVR